MTRWPRRVLIVALAGASVVEGCFLGGQTGEDTALAEPPGGNCIAGAPAAELARGFEGTHTAQLAWTSFPDGGTHQADTITIVIINEGESGTVCGNMLRVSVAVTVTTSDGAVSASGEGVLSSSTVSASTAQLSFIASGVQLTADLKNVNGTVTLSGTLKDGHGKTANFTSPGPGAGGAPGTP